MYQSKTSVTNSFPQPEATLVTNILHDAKGMCLLLNPIFLVFGLTVQVSLRFADTAIEFGFGIGKPTPGKAVWSSDLRNEEMPRKAAVSQQFLDISQICGFSPALLGKAPRMDSSMWVVGQQSWLAMWPPSLRLGRFLCRGSRRPSCYCAVAMRLMHWLTCIIHILCL